MPVTIVVGLQWGDEGKGKATDLLAESVDLVVRYQGGDNAGHTVVLGEAVFALHLVPSGVLYPHVTPIIGGGVVVNPQTLLDEIAMLESRGVATGRVRVSEAAHVILPYHVALDGAMEARLAGEEIGTTRRGIGPAYADRAWRIGLRMADLLEPDVLRAHLERVLPEKNAVLMQTYGLAPVELEALIERATDWGARLRPHIADTTGLVQSALAAGRHVLLEGAQGTLLDLDHGTYPYVTSSNPIAGGACTGGGVGPLQVDEVVGVMKAYATRVGSGPFPTELNDATGRYLLEQGHEFGTTTGRRRRCGWFDAVPLRRAVALNSVSAIMLNKLDILSGLPQVRVCVAYRIDGQLVRELPASAERLARAEPVYETFEGWTEDLGAVRGAEALPAAARRYVEALEELAGAPIAIVSVGADRTATIVRGKRPRRPALHGPTLPGAWWASGASATGSAAGPEPKAGRDGAPLA
ncbi:MAG: adenylosuccinate synthase [Candidatus Limnocylindrales bacterium]